MDVTLVTIGGQPDDLSDEDYWDIYAHELRGWTPWTAAEKAGLAGKAKGLIAVDPEGYYAVGLDTFLKQVGVPPSKGMWSNYHKGRQRLTAQMKNRLRKAVDRPELALTIEEATARARADAAVYQLGDEAAGKILMVGTPDDVDIAVRGETVSVRKLQTSPVMRITRPRSHIMVPPALFDTHNELRAFLGLSWTDYLEQCRQALEEKLGREE